VGRIDVIHPIDSPEPSEGTGTQQPRGKVDPATAAGKNFAAVFAREKNAPGAASGPRAKLPIQAPDHEVWCHVNGNDRYARIVDGPRKGQFVNLSHGARRGEVFKVEMRDGKRVHVYGEGDHEFVVAAEKDSGFVANGVRPGGVHVPKGEQWGPVKGVSNYADILSGPRLGYFVNTSGGIRNGMAFQIVRKGGQTYHVYGHGTNRQWIRVHNPKAAPHHSTGQSDSSTGGTHAPTGTNSHPSGGGQQSTGGTSLPANSHGGTPS
jgi:hypothetical protein